ncbi:MAG: hypothetical protein RLZ63_1502, partial [Pseudomonadota bacterium]
GDDHGIKLLGQGPGMVFNIGQQNLAVGAGALQSIGVAVHAQDGVSTLLQKLHVAPMTTGQVQHKATWGQKVMPAFNPG